MGRGQKFIFLLGIFFFFLIAFLLLFLKDLYNKYVIQSLPPLSACLIYMMLLYYMNLNGSCINMTTVIEQFGNAVYTIIFITTRQDTNWEERGKFHYRGFNVKGYFTFLCCVLNISLRSMKYVSY
jgi:hypothetical protein